MQYESNPANVLRDIVLKRNTDAHTHRHKARHGDDNTPPLLLRGQGIKSVVILPGGFSACGSSPEGSSVAEGWEPNNKTINIHVDYSHSVFINIRINNC